MKCPRHTKNGLIRQRTFLLQYHPISPISLISLTKTSLFHMAKLLPYSKARLMGRKFDYAV